MAKLNPLKTPFAIGHFILGFVSTWFTWQFGPLILDIVNNLNLYSDWNQSEISPIIWFGMILLSIIYMIGVPVWILFEDDEE